MDMMMMMNHGDNDLGDDSDDLAKQKRSFILSTKCGKTLLTSRMQS